MNYSTLADGASCESSQPLRETLVLRSAVCRSSSSHEDGPSTWHSVIATLEVSQSHYYDSSNSIQLLPSRLPTLVRNCTNPSSQGLLFCHLIESLASLRSSRKSSELLCAKTYKNLAAFISQLSQGDFPSIKLKVVTMYL